MRTLVVLALLAFAACDPAEPTGEAKSGGGGKADDQDDSSDAPQCGPSIPSYFGESPSALDEFALDDYEVTERDLPNLVDIEKAQMLEAVAVHGFIAPRADLAEAFDKIDAKGFRFRPLDLEIAHSRVLATMITFEIGGVEHGAILTNGYTRIEALIVSGVIQGCEVPPLPLIPVAVTCEPGSVLGDTEEGLLEWITNSETVTKADAEYVGELGSHQFFEALVHHGFAKRTDALDVVYDLVDGGELQWHNVETEVAHAPIILQWVQFSVRGTNYGALFTSGTLTIEFSIVGSAVSWCTVDDSAS